MPSQRAVGCLATLDSVRVLQIWELRIGNVANCLLRLCMLSVPCALAALQIGRCDVDAEGICGECFLCVIFCSAAPENTSHELAVHGLRVVSHPRGVWMVVICGEFDGMRDAGSQGLSVQ